ncbi:hypothetical protein ABC733_26130 [Mangrovibacter sp. SLW1]
MQRIDTKEIPVWCSANNVVRSSTKKMAGSEKILTEIFLCGVFARKHQSKDYALTGLEAVIHYSCG